MNFYESFLELLKTKYPETAKDYDFSKLLIPELISPAIVEVKKEKIDLISKQIKSFFKLRQNLEYQKEIISRTPQLKEIYKNGFPKNKSILMSYDYHIPENSDPKLIEINTNASMGLISSYLYEFQKLKNYFSNEIPFDQDILNCIQSEFQKAESPNLFQSICITDDKPENQKLYIEFLLYKELFKKLKLQSSIFDRQEIPVDKTQFIYNRSTDFYLTEPESAKLRQACLNSVCLSPNPYEYALLADKQRYLDWQEMDLTSYNLSTDEISEIQRCLLKTYSVSKLNDPEFLWTNRKSLFFKTVNSYGGKASYRGQGISRGVFQNILQNSHYLAQEIAPIPNLQLEFKGQNIEFKYDVRFYVYEDRIQMGCARLWKGQLTNVQTLGGGLAPIKIV